MFGSHCSLRRTKRRRTGYAEVAGAEREAFMEQIQAAKAKLSGISGDAGAGREDQRAVPEAF